MLIISAKFLNPLKIYLLLTRCLHVNDVWLWMWMLLFGVNKGTDKVVLDYSFVSFFYEKLCCGTLYNHLVDKILITTATVFNEELSK